jgi:hypothetical protein
MQDLNGRGFKGLLSRTTVHAVAGMGKTRGQRIKRNFFLRERERERERRNTLILDLVSLLV